MPNDIAHATPDKCGAEWGEDGDSLDRGVRVFGKNEGDFLHRTGVEIFELDGRVHRYEVGWGRVGIDDRRALKFCVQFRQGVVVVRMQCNDEHPAQLRISLAD